MNGSPTERFRRVDTIFDAAVDLPTDAQVAYIDRAAAGDTALRDEVLGLLRAYHRSDIFDSAAADLAAPILEAAVNLAGPLPDQIGAFRVVREIGRGGMGRVYLGERADGEFEQRVALKLIQQSAPGIVRRFVEERRILARLDHPGIARLVDGGITAGGLPYFAMELVEGEPIDRYCESRQLTIEQRLDLFVHVCDAVSYAHQHLIIHRDLKPSNILVRADGQVKLLDFGIAKLLGSPGTTDLTRTEFSAMTPEFAAPEQVRGTSISTATDVYSLGVLLYMLLTGARPYDVRGKAPAEIERIVCTELPTKPSLRAPVAAARRLRGDLDIIVMTALQKDESRRYQSSAALAQDIQRYRQGRAILARPDSTSYRFGKFIRRNRTTVALSAATAIGLVGATVFSVVQMQEAKAQREQAVRSAQRANALTELQSVLAGDTRDPDGRPLPPAGRIEMAERVVTRRFASDPWLVAELMADLSNRYFEAGDLKAQRAMLARARTVAIESKGHNALALANCLRSNNYWIEDILDSARTAVDEAKAALASTTPDRDVRAICLEAEGKLLQATGKPDSGIALLKQAVAIGEADGANTQQLGLTNSLAEVLRRSGRTREAVPYFERILADLETLGYGETESFPNVVNFLATSMVDLGEFAAVDSTVRVYIREREAKYGSGRVPTLFAFLHARSQLRLGAFDSADVWLTRAMRDTTQGAGQFQAFLPSVLADLRLSQSRLPEARGAVSRLPDDRRGQRATATMLRARLRRADGDARGASQMLEQEMGKLMTDGQQRLTLFALPLVTAGEWRLAAGDASGADSIALLARTASAIDSLALQRSALAGRAELLSARARQAKGDVSSAREAAQRAVTALANGYGPAHAWTATARQLLDSLGKQ